MTDASSSLLALEGKLVEAKEALRDLLALVENEFADFANEECTTWEEGDLCPTCRDNGCIWLKVDAARRSLKGAGE